ncbi:MAG: M20 family metallopeptidase [Actinomycetota bacterium]
MAREFRIDRDLVLECARALVRAPSENPPGDERAVADQAARFAREAGLDVQIVQTAPSRCNVVATLDSGRPGRTLLWNGHIDVVPVVDAARWMHPPFEAVVEGGILHGRGSADMKGACAAAIAAAAALKQAGLPGSGRLTLHLVADEEVLGPHGTTALYERGMAAADAAIVGEPTDLSVAIAERGMVWVVARTKGVAAHGSRPDLGRNAIEEMARLIPALRAIVSPLEHPLLGTPTLNIGTIHGGAKINIVPDACEIEIDRRRLPGESHEDVLTQMHAAAAAAGVEATFEIIHSAEPCECDEDAEIVQLARAAHQAVRGSAAAISGMTGVTDAHTLQGIAKIPTIILGPGSLAQAHTVDEWVRVDDLGDAAEMYARIAADFLA